MAQNSEIITHTYLGPDPEPEAVAWAENSINSSGERRKVFQEYVDMAPNHNGEYRAEIDLIEAQFDEAGLEITPVVVLDKEHYAEACAIVGDAAGDKNYGKYVEGRTLIQADPEPGIEKFGSDYILGVGLHESAHSTAREAHDVFTSKLVAEEVEAAIGGTALQVSRYHGGVTGLSGFHKYKWEGNKMRGTGDYLEEAFCDLTRVKALERLGREPKADGEEIVFDKRGVKYVGTGVEAPIIDQEKGLVNVPVKYSLATTPGEDGATKALFGEPGIAAYGVELLDKRVPGLFEAMQASRKDPAMQREVIKKIESVQPGLYKRLRDLPYSDKGFGEGLKAVVQALELES